MAGLGWRWQWSPVVLGCGRPALAGTAGAALDRFVSEGARDHAGDVAAVRNLGQALEALLDDQRLLSVSLANRHDPILRRRPCSAVAVALQGTPTAAQVVVGLLLGATAGDPALA